MKRWVVLIRAVDGTVADRHPFVFRRNAVKYAGQMRSPLYDVLLRGPDGAERVLHVHTSPAELAEQLRRGDNPFRRSR